MIIDKIIEYKKKELIEIKNNKPFGELLRELDKKNIKQRDFRRAIKREKDTAIRLIAEIKKASPSQGIIRNDFNPQEIGLVYAREGANALSILTDKYFFQGASEYIGLVRNIVDLPILRKDFIFDEYQLYESVNIGADAVLLIAAILDSKNLWKLYQTAVRELNLFVLVEVHTEDEAKLALDIGADIIGINNRDLGTFEVDIQISRQIRPLIPRETHIVVSESGIKKQSDVHYLSELNIDALLIGETFMRSNDISAKIMELFS